MTVTVENKGLGPLGRIVIFVAVIAIILILVAMPLTNLLVAPIVDFFGGISQYNSSTIAAPQISLGGGINGTLTFPKNYSALANYTLGLINSGRQVFGDPPVFLSSVLSAQQHADSMLANAYFSHWDTQGLKPYMRYSLLGGTGAVEENIALSVTSASVYTSISPVENSISQLEHDMIYNDSACCHNDHRANILDADHNRVAIGIVYDSKHLYFVEDFETYYGDIHFNLNSFNYVGVSGSVYDSNLSPPTEILVFYDATPNPLTPSTLNTKYQMPYAPGDFIGGVLPPCFNINCGKFVTGITVYATEWLNSPLTIAFSVKSFFDQNESGVYTFYLAYQSNFGKTVDLTSYSMFIVR